MRSNLAYKLEKLQHSSWWITRIRSELDDRLQHGRRRLFKQVAKELVGMLRFKVQRLQLLVVRLCPRRWEVSTGTPQLSTRPFAKSTAA
jgi:hypothetical protein